MARAKGKTMQDPWADLVQQARALVGEIDARGWVAVCPRMPPMIVALADEVESLRASVTPGAVDTRLVEVERLKAQVERLTEERAVYQAAFHGCKLAFENASQIIRQAQLEWPG